MILTPLQEAEQRGDPRRRDRLAAAWAIQTKHQQTNAESMVQTSTALGVPRNTAFKFAPTPPRIFEE